MQSRSCPCFKLKRMTQFSLAWSLRQLQSYTIDATCYTDWNPYSCSYHGYKRTERRQGNSKVHKNNIEHLSNRHDFTLFFLHSLWNLIHVVRRMSRKLSLVFRPTRQRVTATPIDRSKQSLRLHLIWRKQAKSDTYDIFFYCFDFEVWSSKIGTVTELHRHGC